MLTSIGSLPTSFLFCQPALAGKTKTVSIPIPKSRIASANLPPGANTVSSHKQILRTGVDLCDRYISPNSKQLSDIIGLSPLIDRLYTAKRNYENLAGANNLEKVTARQDYLECQLQAVQLLQRTQLEIDFVEAEIDAEQNLYAELLTTLEQNRDRLVARTNAASFYTNGALWAAAEGLTIPTFRHSNYAIPSGITGIVAGVIPSFFSLWAMRQYSGKKSKTIVEPNMLAKVFDYPTTPEIEYPRSIWEYLNTRPYDQAGKRLMEKTRRDQLIETWIEDKNIPSFTDRSSKKQLDIITASGEVKDGLNIDSLNTRDVMLEQLQGEVGKMKRLLMELVMVVSGDKQFTVNR